MFQYFCTEDKRHGQNQYLLPPAVSRPKTKHTHSQNQYLLAVSVVSGPKTRDIHRQNQYLLSL